MSRRVFKRPNQETLDRGTPANYQNEFDDMVDDRMGMVERKLSDIAFVRESLETPPTQFFKAGELGQQRDPSMISSLKKEVDKLHFESGGELFELQRKKRLQSDSRQMLKEKLKKMKPPKGKPPTTKRPTMKSMKLPKGMPPTTKRPRIGGGERPQDFATRLQQDKLPGEVNNF